MLRATGADSIDALWTSLSAQSFFVSPADREVWGSLFRQSFPVHADEVMAAADAALRHEFNLLGSGTVALGGSLPWSTDFKSGKVWPSQYGADIEYNELDRPTDVKVPWELSRCQHFTRLGQAYWLTGDDRYAREFASQITDWIAANPYAWSVNWACAMDVSLRAVSWIWGFHFMAAAPACRSREFRTAFLRSLYLHGEFVATHLERGPVNGNHYLCDGVGLVFLGSFFASTVRGRRWQQMGRDIVVPEIFNQVTPDGVDFEQSTAYHRLVLEAFATSYLLLQRVGVDVGVEAWARLAKMCDYVAAYAKPNGLAPLVGDADDGRVQVLGTQGINDHRYLLSTAAVVFARGDFKTSAGAFADESFWLLGPDGERRFQEMWADPAPPTSQAFPDAGVFVLRHGDSHVMIDCGDVGMRGIGGHGHNDVLGFELFLNGFNVLTDCGAYLYTASREWRNRFRSTAFHNTVQVDDEELNRFVSPDALWQLRYDAEPFGAALTRGAAADTFCGSHRGYQRLPAAVTHTREFALAKDAPRLLVRDRLETAALHRFTWRFHLDPTVAVRAHGSDLQLSFAGREVWLLPDPAAAAFALSLEPGWVSPSYGVKVPTTVIQWTTSSSAPLTTAFLFAESKLSVNERGTVAARLSCS